MKSTFKFENSITNDMPLPDQTCSMEALNIGYAALVHTLEKQLPGFAHDLLTTLDKVYEQNDGATAQLAIAQLAARVKTATSGK
jgi:hypothetical protein